MYLVGQHSVVHMLERMIDAHVRIQLAVADGFGLLLLQLASLSSLSSSALGRVACSGRSGVSLPLFGRLRGIKDRLNQGNNRSWRRGGIY